MKENTKIQTQETTTHDTTEDFNQAAKAGIIMLTSAAGLVGAWAVACMVGAFMSGGIGAMVSGYISAITGM